MPRFMGPPVAIKPNDNGGGYLGPPLPLDPPADPVEGVQPISGNMNAATFNNRQRMLREWQARNPSRQRVMGYDPTNNPAPQVQPGQMTQVDPTGAPVSAIPLPTGLPKPRLYQNIDMPKPEGRNDIEPPTKPGMPQPMPKPGANKPMRSPFDKRGI